MVSFVKTFVVLTTSFVAVCLAQKEPATFELNAKAGGGGTEFKDSARFRVYNISDPQASTVLKLLESGYECMVGAMGWRSSGLSFNSANDNGPWLKMNAYAVPGPQSIGGAAGVMGSDARTGHAFLKVVKNSMTNPGVTIHEYGHCLTYYERYWVDQGNTGTWWEPLANWVADTYMTAPWCEAARTKYGFKEGQTIIDLNTVLGKSHMVIVDGTPGSGNYYQSWPFLSYLTYNPDEYAGLGLHAVRDMIRKYGKRSNETPLHGLQNVIKPLSVQKVVGRYWARMAYVDIGHKQAQKRFQAARARINFANVTPSGAGKYKGKADRAPKYMGANIIPLKGSGQVSVKVTAKGGFTATLAVKSASGTVRYVDLPNGSGSATVASGEEASLVVANTPDKLYIYDGFKIGGEVGKGLDYEFQLTGATA